VQIVEMLIHSRLTFVGDGPSKVWHGGLNLVFSIRMSRSGFTLVVVIVNAS
jgi:hypothetical protein